MPLEHILRAMQAQGESEIEKITHAAETEAAQLIAEAQAEAQAIQTRHRARVEPMLVTQAASLKNKAKLGALRAMADAREQLLVEAFARAEEHLARVRDSSEYPALFSALAIESIQATDGDLIASVDSRDVALARAVFAERCVSVEIETTTIPLGGLEMTARDGCVIINNTLAARLERARKILRGPVAAILTRKLKKEWTASTVMPTPA